MAIYAGASVLLNSNAVFKATQLADVAGMLKGIAKAKTDSEIVALLQQ